MKLLIIRHGDPDYEKDSLTEKGWKEAEYLAEMMSARLADQEPESVHFYMSPLGRARDTASPTLKKLGRTAEEMPWLREFAPLIDRPDDKSKKRISWDWLPQDWTADPRFYQKDHWFENERMADGKVGEEYEWVTYELDELLAKHGYVREGGYYRAVKPNHDTVVLFCHFGCGAVLLSHLMGVSPMTLWHHLCAAPSSVATLVTEERREGIAVFRMSSYGDISHLYVHDEPPAFAARFCECFSDETRHD